MTKLIKIRRPDDMHLHGRDGAMLTGILPESTRHFARGLFMPNLVPREACDKRCAIQALELVKFRADDQPRDDFADIVLLLQIDRNEAFEVVSGIQRFDGISDFDIRLPRRP